MSNFEQFNPNNLKFHPLDDVPSEPFMTPSELVAQRERDALEREFAIAKFLARRERREMKARHAEVPHTAELRISESLLDRLNDLAMLHGELDDFDEWTPHIRTSLGRDEAGRAYAILHPATEDGDFAGLNPTALLVEDEYGVWIYDVTKDGRVSSEIPRDQDVVQHRIWLFERLGGLNAQTERLWTNYHVTLSELTRLMDRNDIEYEQWDKDYLKRRVITIRGFDQLMFKVEQILDDRYKYPMPFTRVTVTRVDQETEEESHVGRYHLTDRGFESINRGLRRLFANRSADRNHDTLLRSLLSLEN